MEAGLGTEPGEICLEDNDSERCTSKDHPSESLRGNPEPPLPSFSGEGVGVHSELSVDHPSTVSADGSPCRSDSEEGEDSMSSFFGATNERSHDTSDLDSSIVSSRDVFYSYLASSSSEATSRQQVEPGHIQEQIGNEKCTEKISDTKSTSGQTQLQQESEKLPKPLNFEANSLIWFPPPPEDVNDEMESSLFSYDDDNDEVGNSGDVYLPTADVDMEVQNKDLDCNDPFKARVWEHFRDLVLQLLQVHRIDSSAGDWLEVITHIAWQAAKYIKPDTNRGGSMDPCDYLKVKCVASGIPSESKLVKGIACTKNIKHKRMISQYKNARLLILGGALEYQRAPDALESVQMLLEQEQNCLDSIVSKIEVHRPNVLLVEKTVSSYALEKLFAKEISVVLNIKRHLLERIARCTSASIIPSIDHISAAKMGHCELFHLEKFSEDHEPSNQLNRKPLKTLMFFEGCPRRTACTIVLKGASRDELKKVKCSVPYAVFAAYQLLLEISFLADEGALLPSHPVAAGCTACDKTEATVDSQPMDLLLEHRLDRYLSDLGETGQDYFPVPDELGYREDLDQECDDSNILALDDVWPGNSGLLNIPIEEPASQVDQTGDVEVSSPVKDDDNEIFEEQSSGIDSNQSILVSFSKHCMVNGNACEKTRLLRVKFYGPSDKPLGRYLTDDLLDQSHLCRSCNEPADAHVICYTHQNANLAIKVRHLPTVKLPGERDRKIWMWHRCLKCEPVEGVPPATKRVVMSDVAWGLSFGKFLEFSFYNHVTGNRVASCGHSLQRDCLRFFGFGSMIASFQYSHIDILSVQLPPPILEFDHPVEQSWIRKEASELFTKAEALFNEISSALEAVKSKCPSLENGLSDSSVLQSLFAELNDILVNEKNQYKELQQLGNKVTVQMEQVASEVSELNRLRDSLSICSRAWERRLYLLQAFIQRNYPSDCPNDATAEFPKDSSLDLVYQDIMIEADGSVKPDEVFELSKEMGKFGIGGGNVGRNTSLLRHPSAASILSDRIDSAWSGVDQSVIEDDPSVPGTPFFGQTNPEEDSSGRRLMETARFHSFDNAETAHASMLSITRRPFHSSGDLRAMIRDPTPRFLQLAPSESGKLDLSSAVQQEDIPVMVYDNEPTSIISCVLSSKEYEGWIFDRSSSSGPESVSHVGVLGKLGALSPWQSFSSTATNHASNGQSFVIEEQNGSPHVQISFEEESSKAAGKVKYSATCYFAREFDALRKKCCPSKGDYIRSLSRSREWHAQGGKSNVYFAKSLDERFIIKQVTKTELESFEEFGPDYFKYLTEALSSRSPTCLAKVLGMYQVTVKPMKGGKEVKKMDVMVMENLFFKRNISKVYDLKGSVRSRYISDPGGSGKVLLDMNLLETVGKNPIFVGSKAKRNLERAVWNDTSLLASVGVMDYSLLVGVDEERKELVMGIIDFMRQYTWDKQLETWVKASGILGGPKNAAPTIISPKQYKKRFRKAMTSYFLTVPDQWTS